MANGETIRCSDSNWPLAVCRFVGSLDDEDFEAYLQFLSAVHHRRELFGLLLDASQVRGIKATQRREMADFLRDHEPLSRQFCFGTAFVFTSPLVRGTITAVFWFQRQPTPYTIVASEAQAVRWLQNQAQQYGTSLPAGVVGCP